MAGTRPCGADLDSPLQPRRSRREPLIPRSLSFWLTIVLLWAAYGLLSTNQSFLFYSLTSSDVPQWGKLFKLSLGLMAVWALVTPLLIFLARRFRVRRHDWQSRALLHVSFALACWLVLAALTWGLHGVVAPPRPRSFVGYALLQLDVSVFLYFVMVALAHAFDFHVMYQERELRAAQLENQLTTAKLHVLAMQLQPHFLFNALNAIAELVHRDPERADAMLARLGQLLRRSMENGQKQEVSLTSELEFLEDYVAIERLRYGERLTVSVEASGDVLHALVPGFVLQPLVENAIRHGTARRSGAGWISVRASRRGQVVRLEVRDNGGGPDGESRDGVGLGNTRARLAQLYGRAHRMELGRGEAGGAIVEIEIPFRPAPQGDTRDRERPAAAPTQPALAVQGV
jgi:two-component system LytT family sensor kinase